MLGTEKLPLRVAIAGAGPSGMYAADALFKSGKHVVIDCYDRLPTPYGLLRGGVAPDHQKMKSVGKFYDRIAAQTGFSFFGNIKIGTDLSVRDLQSSYDAVIFCCGAETDKSLSIPGESLPGSYAATEFVGWYNGHPDYQDRHFDLNQSVVAVIGQGNVAIDVTRILAKTPDELKESDMTENAMAALANSKIREIHLIGRRGPVQAAFTELEIQELGELADCDVVVNPEDLKLSDACRKELEMEGNSKARKNMAVLETLAARKPAGKRKKIMIHFFKSPEQINGKNHVDGLSLVTNRLEGPPGNQQAVKTTQRSQIPCGIVFRSVGYRGTAIPGLPFDSKKGIFPNIAGRIVDAGRPLAGLYAAGWIKRGPSGVLGTNKPDSTQTVACLLEDLPSLRPSPDRNNGRLLNKLAQQNHPVVTFEDWQKIDKIEIENGQKAGKPREKFRFIADMLAVCQKERG